MREEHVCWDCKWKNLHQNDVEMETAKQQHINTNRRTKKKDRGKNGEWNYSSPALSMNHFGISQVLRCSGFQDITSSTPFDYIHFGTINIFSHILDCFIHLGHES